MIWKHHPLTAWEPAPDALACYVVNATGGGIVVLQDNAALIWESLDGHTTDEVAAAVAAEYELPVDEIAGDVTAFLADLRNQGLVVHG